MQTRLGRRSLLRRITPTRGMSDKNVVEPVGWTTSRGLIADERPLKRSDRFALADPPLCSPTRASGSEWRGARAAEWDALLRH